MLTKSGEHENTHTETAQGDILSSLLTNIALSALDEHLMRAMEAGRLDVNCLPV
ncbi:hypothetical protein [Mycobacterium lepromatosis]|uniref:hypothetical protein n=1 Tax=Mycobacterium lepromatosis TaxID=480418 RepID=UPI0018722999|nr:hypothetical protein [Mycobacterium lepromatosis]UKN41524.1 hypothetical protein MLPF_0172 [Mycobacterium lepromatosis]UKN42194.1 hypothetical protein MLPF_1408 [Mycobacterium lepromatosis]UKN42666.1 hypothetical protein MLPF_2307 [Mycobacterium lepromatosis]UKN43041.1 hypothetical protein MLPF_3132 [Mycobacterium lepromatosis]UKN43100.1 hypothetical protein MLPF_3267 [Mycobacterium lepromatosis]